MRILHVIPHYFPAVRYGGPIRSVHGLAAATAALGHDVHVYTTNADGNSVCDVPTDQAVNLDGVKVWYFPIGRGRKVFRSPAMGKALDQNISSFDLIHIHYMWTWTTLRAASAARRQEVPYILAPRGMLVSDLIRRRSLFAKRVWLAFFGARDVANAAAIHVTSERELNDMDEVGLRYRRASILPNGVDLGEHHIQTTPTVAEFKAPYLLFLGRISWKKGLDRLIRALPMIPDAELVIAGYDELRYQEVVEHLADECRVRNRVHFVGPIEGQLKMRVLRNAACLVLPSYNENFGMVVVEAMSSAIPVVLTPEVGLAGVVESSGCGLVASGEPFELAQAINHILRHPDQAKAMGNAGYRIARDNFSWNAIAQDAVALYQQCRDREHE